MKNITRIINFERIEERSWKGIVCNKLPHNRSRSHDMMIIIIIIIIHRVQVAQFIKKFTRIIDDRATKNHLDHRLPLSSTIRQSGIDPRVIGALLTWPDLV